MNKHPHDKDLMQLGMQYREKILKLKNLIVDWDKKNTRKNLCAFVTLERAEERKSVLKLAQGGENYVFEAAGEPSDVYYENFCISELEITNRKILTLAVAYV